MTKLLKSTVLILLLATSLTRAVAARAETLAIDFQPTGGTTAAGYQAFEATNQVLPVAGMNYAAFGTTVTVSLATANRPTAISTSGRSPATAPRGI